MKIKCSIYRGGTSRGIIFNKIDLPKNKDSWANIFKQVIDCYNQNSIDGLGGSISSTNKICVVSKSYTKEYDVEWEFFQLGVIQDSIDNKGTCGNLIAAVGAYAINEKLFDFDTNASKVCVKIFNNNINKVIEFHAELENGYFKEQGNDYMQGVIGECSLAEIFIKNAGGEKCGSVYPLGKICKLDKYNATFCDLINPFVYVDASELEFDFNLSYDEFLQHKNFDLLNKLRDLATLKVGFAKNEDELSKNQAIPKIACVFKSNNNEFDIGVRVLSLGNLHKSSPASGLYNIACACLEEETLLNNITGLKMIDNGIQNVRIAHFLGIVEVSVEICNKKIIGVGLKRSARRIMDGFVFIK